MAKKGHASNPGRVRAGGPQVFEFLPHPFTGWKTEAKETGKLGQGHTKSQAEQGGLEFRVTHSLSQVVIEHLSIKYQEVFPVWDTEPVDPILTPMD